MKTQCGKIEDKVWMQQRCANNPYERVPDLCAYKPVSRAYFKMIELIHQYQLLHEPIIQTIHFAEGPGGFMEAIYQCCLRYRLPIPAMHGITLKTEKTNNDFVDENLFHRNPYMYIHYGQDGTGNLYRPENIQHFAKTTGKSQLITGDGGFPETSIAGSYSKDELTNAKEQLHHALLFAQTIGALMTQIGKRFLTEHGEHFNSFEM